MVWFDMIELDRDWYLPGAGVNLQRFGGAQFFSFSFLFN
jgi:hypothetical protein